MRRSRNSGVHVNQGPHCLRFFAAPSPGGRICAEGLELGLPKPLTELRIYMGCSFGALKCLYELCRNHEGEF